VSYKIAEELYKQQGAGQGGAQGAGPDMGGFDPNNMGNMGGGAPGGNETKGAEDADYEVVDDK
jgi:hypothetical protein